MNKINELLKRTLDNEFLVSFAAKLGRMVKTLYLENE
jgi:hypothetical protein